MAKLGRDGRVSKQFVGVAVPAHPGMRFVDSLDGTHYVSVSRTQAAHPLDDSKQVHVPRIEKSVYKNGQVPTHPSQVSRREHTAKRGDANAVLNDAVLRVGK